MEADRHAGLRDHHDLVVAVGQLGGDQAIAVFDIDADDTTLAVIGVLRDLGLLDGAVGGAHHEELAFLEVRDADHRGQLLVVLELKEASNRLTAGSAVGFFDFVDLLHVHAAIVHEEQDMVVGIGREEVFDEVAVVVGRGLGELGALGALASALLEAVLGDRRTFDEARMRDSDHAAFVGDDVLHREVAFLGRDLRLARTDVLLGGVTQLLLNQGEQLQLAREDAAEFFDECHQFAVLSLDLVALQSGELVEAQVEDGHGLAFAEAVLGHQLHSSLVAVGRGADDLHEVVQITQGDLEALEDVGAVFGLAETEAGTAGDDIAAVLNEAFEQLADVHLLRATLVEGEQDDAERVFEVRVLVELVDDDLRVLVALELDDHARVFVGLVAEVGDLIQHLVGAELRDVLHQGGTVDVIGQLREDDLLLAVLHLLRVGYAADTDNTTAGAQVLLDAILTVDDAAGRDVRTDDDLLQVFDGGAGLVDDEAGRLDELVQVMGRDVGRHTDRDAGRTVHQ